LNLIRFLSAQLSSLSRLNNNRINKIIKFVFYLCKTAFKRLLREFHLLCHSVIYISLSRTDR